MTDLCPNCGAQVRANPDPTSDSLCPYCQSVLRAGLPATPDGGGLPPEYRNLRTPRAVTPLRVFSVGIEFGFGLLVVFTSLAVMIIALSSLAAETARYRRLTSEGRVAQAEITLLRIQSGTRQFTNLYAHFCFSAALNGVPTTFEAQNLIDTPLYRSLKKGQRVAVVYAASDPNVVLLQTLFVPPDRTGPLAISAIALLFMIAGLALGYHAFTILENKRALRRAGKLAKAVLIERWEEKRSDGRLDYAVAVAFKVSQAGGPSRIITHSELNHPLYHASAIGQPIQVRYLEEDPQVCEILG